MKSADEDALHGSTKSGLLLPKVGGELLSALYSFRYTACVFAVLSILTASIVRLLSVTLIKAAVSTLSVTRRFEICVVVADSDIVFAMLCSKYSVSYCTARS